MEKLAGAPHEVLDMLPYACYDGEVQPDDVYQMSGSQISVKTLDPALPYEEMIRKLDGIAKAHFLLGPIVEII